MHQACFQSELFQQLNYVAIRPPEKSQLVFLTITNDEQVKNFLYVACNSVRISSEPTEHGTFTPLLGDF